MIARLRTALLVPSALLVACSSDPTLPTATFNVTGVIVSDTAKVGGAFTLKSDQALTESLTILEPGFTGTFALVGSSTLALQGTYSVSGSSIALRGQTTSADKLYLVQGTLTDGVFGGVWNGPAGVTGKASGLDGAAQTFCSTSTVGARVHVVASDTVAGGVAASGTGAGLVIVGTRSGANITATVPPSGTATAAIAGDRLTGSWTNGTTKTPFEASSAACPR